MKQTAIIITGGLLSGSSAKTAHGLIRSSDRFRIAGIIDHLCAGKNAREIVGERDGYLPVFDNLAEAISNIPSKIDFAIVGVAPKGGKLPPEIKSILLECMAQGISLISGLHEFIGDMPDMAALAEKNGVTITDIRKPVDRQYLHFWTGKIYDVKCPIIAVVGMETNMGKRTTTKLLKDACNANGIHAGMVFTGQTGWLQDGQYGFVLDTTVNDFVSGELEHWVCKCADELQPDVIFIEGQSGLRNPSGPCGSEMLLSANAKQVILMVSPKRKYFGDNRPNWGEIPSVESEIALIKMYGSRVIALVLHTKDCTSEEALQWQKHYKEKTGLSVILPLRDGVEELVPVIKGMISHSIPKTVDIKH